MGRARVGASSRVNESWCKSFVRGTLPFGQRDHGAAMRASLVVSAVLAVLCDLRCSAAAPADARHGPASAEPWSFAPFDPKWTAPNWGKLDRDGYVYIRNFVTGNVQQWSRRTTATWEKNVVKFPGPGSRARDGPEAVRLRKAVRMLMSNITHSQKTSLSVDYIKDSIHCDDGATTSYYFSSGTPANKQAADELNKVMGNILSFAKGLDWHTDMSFIWDPDHEASHEWLNFYIPVFKRRRDDANLEFLPFSAIPDLRDMLEGSCSKGYMLAPRNSPAGGKPVAGKKGKGQNGKGGHNGASRSKNATSGMKVVEHDLMGCASTRSFEGSILDKAIAPKLAEGDLLILRGDVIHRTGKRSHLPFRLALSLRALKTPTEESMARQCILRRAARTATDVSRSRYNQLLCDPAKRRSQ